MNVNQFTNYYKEKQDGGFKMEDYKKGIQSLIGMATKGDEQALLILKEIDIFLDECEIGMDKKKDDC